MPKKKRAKPGRKWGKFWIPALAIAGLLTFVVVLAYLTINFFKKFDPDNSRLNAESKTPACATELNQALKSLGAQMGLPYAVGPEDFRSLSETGRTTKDYHRDGGHFVSFFLLARGTTGCELRYYRQDESTAGRTRSVLMDSRITLRRCKCD